MDRGRCMFSSSAEYDARVLLARVMLSMQSCNVRGGSTVRVRGDSMASTIAKKVASTAEKQHDIFEMMNEADKKLCAQIKKYWTEIGFTFTSCTSEPWSAVFVSWCVLKAGVGANKFLFHIRHSEFAFDAIN